MDGRGVVSTSVPPVQLCPPCQQWPPSQQRPTWKTAAKAATTWMARRAAGGGSRNSRKPRKTWRVGVGGEWEVGVGWGWCRVRDRTGRGGAGLGGGKGRGRAGQRRGCSTNIRTDEVQAQASCGLATPMDKARGGSRAGSKPEGSRQACASSAPTRASSGHLHLHLLHPLRYACSSGPTRRAPGTASRAHRQQGEEALAGEAHDGQGGLH